MAAIRNEDLLALKSYITAPSSTNHAPTTILLDITHSNLIQRHIELRFDKHDTISLLRRRIHRQTGTPPHYQHLKLYDGFRNVISEIPPGRYEDTKLGYFSLEDGTEVHCVDIDPHSGSKGGWYEDTTLVEKYRMSDEEYDKRKGTLRDWGREKKKEDESFTFERYEREQRELAEARRLVKLGGNVPEGFTLDGDGTVVRNVEKKDVIAPGADSVVGISVGARCEVTPGGRRGRVAFVGEVTNVGGGGYWVGVVFDEPVGKTDGSVKGTRYFEAEAGFGGFVRGKNLEVGDFPERDLFEDGETDSEDEL